MKHLKSFIENLKYPSDTNGKISEVRDYLNDILTDLIDTGYEVEFNRRVVNIYTSDIQIYIKNLDKLFTIVEILDYIVRSDNYMKSEGYFLHDLNFLTEYGSYSLHSNDLRKIKESYMKGETPTYFLNTSEKRDNYDLLKYKTSNLCLNFRIDSTLKKKSSVDESIKRSSDHRTLKTSIIQNKESKMSNLNRDEVIDCFPELIDAGFELSKFKKLFSQSRILFTKKSLNNKIVNIEGGFHKGIFSLTRMTSVTTYPADISKILEDLKDGFSRLFLYLDENSKIRFSFNTDNPFDYEPIYKIDIYTK